MTLDYGFGFVEHSRNEWRHGGVNFTAEQAEGLHRTGMLGRCRASGRVFSVMNVTVVQRYMDCSVFKCPACGGQHDDRQGWGSNPDARMGYEVVR